MFLKCILFNHSVEFIFEWNNYRLCFDDLIFNKVQMKVCYANLTFTRKKVCYANNPHSCKSSCWLLRFVCWMCLSKWVITLLTVVLIVRMKVVFLNLYRTGLNHMNREHIRIRWIKTRFVYNLLIKINFRKELFRFLPKKW